ncbi:MAG: redoxin domain-containing protein [Sediminibacterium sp.]
MKKILLGFIAIASFQTIMAQGLHITANLKNVPDNTTVSLIDGMANKVVDSAKVTGGAFQLKATVTSPGIFVVSFAGMQAQIPVFVGNDQLSISGDLKDAKNMVYQGSVTQDLYLQYMKVLTPQIEGLFGAKNVGATATGATKDSALKQVTLRETGIANSLTELMKANSQSPVSTLFLLQVTNFVPAVKENLGTYYDLLSGAAKTGPFADYITKTIATAGVGNIGTVLPDFKQNDVNGKSVSLSSFRGKYVLVDFWASWCGPCRAENPNVVKTYNAFKNKNFTVLGVSLDQDKARWLEAIKKDGLTWTHVSDLKYWNNAVAVQFGIQSIPASFLIDPNGVVIGRDLRGEDLTRVLNEKIK